MNFDLWFFFFRPRRGIPIGNLTSQIFANIYLNELDRRVKYVVKPKVYLRYGDDFIIISDNVSKLEQERGEVVKFIQEKLRLEINLKRDIVIKARRGLHFLGVEIFSSQNVAARDAEEPKGRRLCQRNWQRSMARLTVRNIGSYSGLVLRHSSERRIEEFNWVVLQKMEND